MHEGNQETFLSATKNKNFSYWFRYEDLVAVRKYIPNLDSRSCSFEIIGSDRQLYNHIKENINESRPQVVILHISEAKHWVLLVINKENGTLTSYYVDSMGNKLVPSRYKCAINECGLSVTSLSIQQQQNGCNCGLYALLNASYLVKQILSKKDVKETKFLVPKHEKWFFENWRLHLCNRLNKCGRETSVIEPFSKFSKFL